MDFSVPEKAVVVSVVSPRVPRERRWYGGVITASFVQTAVKAQVLLLLLPIAAATTDGRCKKEIKIDIYVCLSSLFRLEAANLYRS